MAAITCYGPRSTGATQLHVFCYPRGSPFKGPTVSCRIRSRERFLAIEKPLPDSPTNQACVLGPAPYRRRFGATHALSLWIALNRSFCTSTLSSLVVEGLSSSPYPRQPRTAELRVVQAQRCLIKTLERYSQPYEVVQRAGVRAR